MIPYFPQPELEIAGLKFHAFGAMVALALLVGCWFFVRRARHQHLNERFALIFILWVAGVGLVASHFLNVLIFEPLKLLVSPLQGINIGQSIYSFGGVVGGVATAWFLLRRYRISSDDRWRYFDNLVFAFTIGWIFGRAGCTLAHDHIGVPSNSLLAVRFPDTPRYDLGLLELIYTLLLAAVFFLLNRRPRPSGLYAGLFFLTYGAFRLWRDTLEVEVSPRYFGWTPDGLFSIACLVSGCLIFVRMFRQHSHAYA